MRHHPRVARLPPSCDSRATASTTAILEWSARNQFDWPSEIENLVEGRRSRHAVPPEVRLSVRARRPLHRSGYSTRYVSAQPLQAPLVLPHPVETPVRAGVVRRAL